MRNLELAHSMTPGFHRCWAKPWAAFAELGLPKSLFLLFLVVAQLGLTGCSVILLTAGLIIDHARPDSVVISKDNLKAIRPYDRLCLDVGAQAPVYGKYLRMENIPVQRYAALYQAAQERMVGELSLPALGDIVTLSAPRGDQWRGQLVGFTGETVVIWPPGHNRPWEERFDKLDFLTAIDAMPIKSSKIRQLMKEERLPDLRGLRVVRNWGKREVYALSEIRKITVHHPNNAAITGFLVGAVVDLIIVYCISTWKIGPFLEFRSP